MQMGVIPENSMVYGDMSAEQNLHLSGQMYGIPRVDREKRIDELLSRVGLSEKRKLPVRTFSKGMKQRVSIACAIIHRPHLLLLDEPTSGLDVQSRRLVIDAIRDMNGQYPLDESKQPFTVTDTLGAFAPTAEPASFQFSPSGASTARSSR